mmetsp:Transcript_12373/g.34066  ORF Transcript_12373/g.34066 Transcript_12373/m.34066 type:complete len:127 (-) Transcript_12373:493-873(-)
MCSPAGGKSSSEKSELAASNALPRIGNVRLMPRVRLPLMMCGDDDDDVADCILLLIPLRNAKRVGDIGFATNASTTDACICSRSKGADSTTMTKATITNTIAAGRDDLRITIRRRCRAPIPRPRVP